MNSPDAPAGAGDPANPAGPLSSDTAASPAESAGPVPAGAPLLPEQSREDTDAAWGEYAGRDDDHLYRDRPPHWRD